MAEYGKMDSIFKKIKPAEKVMELASAPQRYLMDKAALALGGSGDPMNSERSSQAIVERLAQTVGIPEDSTLGNVGKAAAVAGLEVFADPTNIIPINKLGKAFKAVKNSDRVSKVLEGIKSGQKIIPVEKLSLEQANKMLELGLKPMITGKKP